MKPERWKKIRTAVYASIILVILALPGCWLAACFEYEFPFWPTLWLAEQTRIPDGSRITDLIRIRSGKSYVAQHWHHCALCDVFFPHAPHMAVMVTIDGDPNFFYLFDWDARHLRLLPITVNTAKLFPELIPAGSVLGPIGFKMAPLVPYPDEPCSIVPPSIKSQLSTLPGAMLNRS